MDRDAVMAMIKSHEYLSHYGIKGQKWGERRYQNEDGSLTPEGRRRYGINPNYSNMTDQQLREAISTKQTQNSYVELMTRNARKKRKDMEDFFKTAGETSTGAIIPVVDKTVLNATKKGFDEDIKTANSLIKANTDLRDKSLAANPKANVSKLNAAIKENEEKRDYFTNAKNDVDLVKNLSTESAKAIGQNNKLIAKTLTKSELEKETAEAYRNIQEMDKDQLRKTVDRMLLEKQYDELVNPPKRSTWERGREILQTVGTVLGVVLTGMTIYNLIKDKPGVKNTVGKLKIKHTDVENGEEFLAHYRTKGSRNGVRRYQNEDGTLTPEGYRHYGIDPNGRQAADPRELLQRQRAQQKLDNQAVRAQTKQNAYTQKIARRQALREARTNSQIQRVYDRQTLDAQRRLLREQTANQIRLQREQENAQRRQMREQEKISRREEKEALKNDAERAKTNLALKKENRKDIRKNIVKGVAAIAVIGGAVAIGAHVLRQKSLNAAHVRDLEKLNLQHRHEIENIREHTKAYQMRDLKKLEMTNKQTLDEIRENAAAKQKTDIDIVKENNRRAAEVANEAKAAKESAAKIEADKLKASRDYKEFKKESSYNRREGAKLSNREYKQEMFDKKSRENASVREYNERIKEFENNDRANTRAHVTANKSIENDAEKVRLKQQLEDLLAEKEKRSNAAKAGAQTRKANQVIKAATQVGVSGNNNQTAVTVNIGQESKINRFASKGLNFLHPNKKKK